ncbi:MAG: hypothetical protein MO853_12560 [Candidatus Protistobacter heckmanni]|nr:hypothetical protein [Candidatus Protistobacter heckmanni]
MEAAMRFLPLTILALNACGWAGGGAEQNAVRRAPRSRRAPPFRRCGTRRRGVDESIMGAERFATLADKFSGTRTGSLSDALRVYHRLGDEAIAARRYSRICARSCSASCSAPASIPPPACPRPSINCCAR